MRALLYLISVLSLTKTGVFADGIRTQQLLSKAVGDFNGRIIAGSIRQRTNGTALYCQMLCLWDEEYMSFFHNSITDMCQIHGIVFFNPVDGKRSSGSQYYRQVQELCSSGIGYIYNRALDFCYKFHYLNPGDYDHARLVCQGEGGDLVIVDTEAKLDHIGWTIRASTFPATEYTGFLIGATDEGYTAKDWHWYNGQRVNQNIWNWCPNEPNGPPNNHHIAMDVYDVYPPACVKDVYIYAKHFVCERRI